MENEVEIKFFVLRRFLCLDLVVNLFYFAGLKLLATFASMITGFIFTIFLVFLNGFFVAAEFAIVKVRSSQIEVKKNYGKTVTAVAKNVIGNLDAYLAATQLGVTLSSLGLGWVGEEVFTEIILFIFGLF